jgi:LysM repeat protein
MRKVVLIIGLLLLMQAAWVPAGYAAPPPAGGFWHTVRWGETLFSIGRAYGVNPYSICSANGLHNCNYVWAGQSLWIPDGYWGRDGHGKPGGWDGYNQPVGWDGYGKPGGWDGGYGGCRNSYIVHRGDTLYSIGRMHGVDAWRLAAANGIYNLNMIYAGQCLCIPTGKY